MSKVELLPNDIVIVDDKGTGRYVTRAGKFVIVELLNNGEKIAVLRKECKKYNLMKWARTRQNGERKFRIIKAY